MTEEKSWHPLRQIRNLFITGLLVLVPIGTTVVVVYKLFDLADRNIREFLKPHFESLCKLLFDKTVAIPPYGVGLVVTILTILLAGVVARNLIGRRLISFFEMMMLRVPVVSRIYRVVKQISESLLQRDKNLFQGVVLIEYPRRGIYSLGFVTSTDSPVVFEKIGKDSVCVFVSTTPNPTSGVLVIIPREDVIPLDISVEDGMKMVISAGVVNPEELDRPSPLTLELLGTTEPSPEDRPDRKPSSAPDPDKADSPS